MLSFWLTVLHDYGLKVPKETFILLKNAMIFHFQITWNVAIKKASLNSRLALYFSSWCYIAFLANSITRSLAIALASSADA